MTMTFKISLDVSNALSAFPAIVTQDVMPNLSAAVYRVADRVSYRWKESIQAAKLWDGERKAYMASVVVKPSGPFAAIVESDYKHAQEIEAGRPAYDLKRALQTSMKVRRAKDGRKYLIIPFRHGAPNSNTNPMPPEDYAQAKALQPSSVVGMTLRVSGQAQHADRWNAVAASRIANGSGPGASRYLVNQRVYQWGDRLQSANKRLDGMVRFDTSAGKQNRSTYLTFRVMAEGSSGWVIPPRPGLHLVGKVVSEMAPKAEIAFQKAMEADTRA